MVVDRHQKENETKKESDGVLSISLFRKTLS